MPSARVKTKFLPLKGVRRFRDQTAEYWLTPSYMLSPALRLVQALDGEFRPLSVLDGFLPTLTGVYYKPSVGDPGYKRFLRRRKYDRRLRNYFVVSRLIGSMHASHITSVITFNHYLFPFSGVDRSMMRLYLSNRLQGREVLVELNAQFSAFCLDTHQLTRTLRWPK